MTTGHGNTAIGIHAGEFSQSNEMVAIGVNALNRQPLSRSRRWLVGVVRRVEAWLLR